LLWYFTGTIGKNPGSGIRPRPASRHRVEVIA